MKTLIVWISIVTFMEKQKFSHNIAQNLIFSLLTIPTTIDFRLSALFRREVLIQSCLSPVLSASYVDSFFLLDVSMYISLKKRKCRFKCYQLFSCQAEKHILQTSQHFSQRVTREAYILWQRRHCLPNASHLIKTGERES